MSKMKCKRLCVMLTLSLLLVCMMGTTAFAAGTGDVAGAVESTWATASTQIKTVVNNVVFPAIDLILAVFFFAKLGTAYFDYRKSGQFEWTAPAILFACLVFTLTAPLYIWQINKTIVNPDGDDSNRGQNAFFYDAAEGLLTSVILILAEFLPPDKEHPQERRHIVSVFKLVQDLLEPSKVKGKGHFQLLMGKLPPDHKARWFAGAALNSAEQAMASVMSTVLSRLNAFLDSELEQVLCFDSAIDAEKFASEKSAIFLILPEEDTTKNFMAGLMIQNLSRELFAVADENGGKLQNRVFLCSRARSISLALRGS